MHASTEHPATSTADEVGRDGHRSDARFVRRHGGIEEFCLQANGLRVLFMPLAIAPVALLMVTYEVGSADETDGFHGASHLLEHLMFKGSDRFNRQQRTSIFDLLHPVGAMTNATTWFDRTQYFSLVPLGHLDVATDIEADRMRNIRIDPTDLEAERTVVLNEHDQYAGDPFEKLNQALWTTAFDRHAYGAPVLGNRDDIRGLTRDRLLQHYDRHYQPDNATVTIIGDVQRENALAIVDRHFGRIPARRRVRGADAIAQPAQRAERRVVVGQSGPSDALMLAYPAPAAASADVDALDLLAGILARGKLSRLYRPLVMAKHAAGVGATTSRLKQPGLFQVQVELGGDRDHDRVERIVRDAIADLRNDGVSRAELDRVKSRARGSLLMSRDGHLAIAMQLNEAIAAGDWTAYPMAVDRLEAVSTADVQRVARMYLTDECLTVAALKSSTGEATSTGCNASDLR